MKKLKQGKWKSFYNQYGIKITRSELAEFKALAPRVREIIRTNKRSFENTIKPKVGNLQNFRSRKTFTHYLGKMRQIARGTYLRNQTILFRKNLIKAIQNAERSRFSDEAIARLTTRLQRMKLSDFQKYSQRYRWRAIGYVYYEEDTSEEELYAMYGL